MDRTIQEFVVACNKAVVSANIRSMKNANEMRATLWAIIETMLKGCLPEGYYYMVNASHTDFVIYREDKINVAGTMLTVNIEYQFKVKVIKSACSPVYMYDNKTVKFAKVVTTIEMPEYDYDDESGKVSIRETVEVDGGYIEVDRCVTKMNGDATELVLMNHADETLKKNMCDPVIKAVKYYKRNIPEVSRYITDTAIDFDGLAEYIQKNMM